LRELTGYLARTCFPETAVPQATADLVDIAATVAPGCRSAEAAARQDAFWEMHDAPPTRAGLRTRTCGHAPSGLGLDVER
jgi:hypothetical protein